jgi:hypothetical protein
MGYRSALRADDATRADDWRPGAATTGCAARRCLGVHETADERSSADAAGAARRYIGTAGGIALCRLRSP